jgi:mannose/fructose-specific phosphotransferase system component IIA
MIQGIVVAHKKYSEAALGALAGMYGTVERLVSVSNEGLSSTELTELIRETADPGGDGICIFVDAFGGSPWRAARSARIPGAVIITGFNLPMLLSFVTKRDTVPFSELPAVLEADGKRGIVVEKG